MSATQEQIEKLRTLQESYDELANKYEEIKHFAKQGDNPDATNSAIYDAINAISPDLVQGKKRLATAITSKGVETTSADSLSQMAENVSGILQSPMLDGESVTGQAIFPQPFMWNLIEEAYSHQRGEYAALILAEFYKGYDSIPLSGADAYYTCDGDFYENATTHIWHDDGLGKVNRYVVYYFHDSGAIFTIGDTNTSPRRMVVIGNFSAIKSAVATRITNIYNCGEIGDLQFTNTTPIMGDFFISGLSDHTAGYLLQAAPNLINCFVELENVNTNLFGFDLAGLYSLKVKVNGTNLNGGVFAQTGGRSGIFLQNLTELEIEADGIDAGQNFGILKVAGGDNYSQNILSALKKITIKGVTSLRSIILGGSDGKKNIGSFELLMPDVEMMTTYLFSGFHPSNTQGVTRIYAPSLTSTSSILLGNTDTGNSVHKITGGLIDIEVGAMTTSLNCQAWNASNILTDTDKRAQLIDNIKNHILARVSDRTGLSQLVFTVATALYNNIASEQIEWQGETMSLADAFLTKNWLMAGA